MKIKLVFEDWKKQGSGKSIYSTEEGLRLSMGQFHSGTTWDGEISLDEEDEDEIRTALKNGFCPIFRISE